MTLTAGTAEKPGFSGKVISKFLDFLAGNNNQRGKAFRLPDASNIVTTTAAESGQAIDLTDEFGASQFLADHVYRVQFRSVASTDNDRWIQTWEQWVLGGTTPVLLGSARLIHAFGVIAGAVADYGVCHAAANFDSSDAAITTTVGTSVLTGANSAGASIGDVATNTAVLTHPIARATGKRVLGINASPDVATNTEALHASVFPATSTTMSVFTTDTATPSADGFDDDGRLEVSFYILPPPSIFLSMNSNNVELHVGHDASDEVRHLVQVWIDEDPLYTPFHGS